MLFSAIAPVTGPSKSLPVLITQRSFVGFQKQNQNDKKGESHTLIFSFCFAHLVNFKLYCRTLVTCPCFFRIKASNLSVHAVETGLEEVKLLDRMERVIVAELAEERRRLKEMQTKDKTQLGVI